MTSPLISKLRSLLDKASSFEPKRYALTSAFALYIILLSAVSFFHEPWFDEAEAWQISKCSSLYDLFFTVPHSEGHPPLWYLLLAPFSKTGMPYEFSLSLVNIIFISAAVWVLMFKTKLPGLMRMLTPFTYFFFYQYGVVSRPYSVMTLALMLCSVFYRNKTQKPVRMVLALALLCLSSAYGLAMAAGICVVWLIEEWNGKNFLAFVKDFVKTKVFFSLLGLLVFAVLILLEVFPDKNATAVSGMTNIKGTFQNLAYTLLILPFDATVGSVLTTDKLFFNTGFLAYTPLSAIVVTILILFGKKHRQRRLLFIPLVFMPILFAAIIFYAHYVGIITVFLIFWLNICFDTEEPPASLGKYDGVLHYIFAAAGCIFILIQIMWTFLSAVAEINHNYSPGREMAAYIKENNLENSNIMCSWTNYESEDGIRYNFNFSAEATVILPYFDSNIFSNFNEGRDDKAYSDHKYYADAEEYDNALKYVQSLSAPEYIFGTLPPRHDDSLDFIFGRYYYPAADMEHSMIFKGNYIVGHTVVYKFKDIKGKGEEHEGTD